MGLQREPCLAPLQEPIRRALEIVFILPPLPLPSLTLAIGSREYWVAR